MKYSSIIFVLAIAGCTIEGKDTPSDSGPVDGGDTDQPTDTDTGTDTGDDPFKLNPGDLPEGDDPCRDPIWVEGLDAVDGDTIWVDLEQGPHEKVRFIGVNTPEIGYDGDPDECYAQEAKTFARNNLEGEGFWLTFDEECYDYYDRTLAYIHTRDGFFQMAMLEGGYAEVMTVAPNDTFASQFQQAEQGAQAAGEGMWGECP